MIYGPETPSLIGHPSIPRPIPAECPGAPQAKLVELSAQLVDPAIEQEHKVRIVWSAPFSAEVPVH